MTVILGITALIGFLILAAKGPSSKQKLKYTRPDPSKVSAQYGVNPNGEIEELLTKDRKREDY